MALNIVFGLLVENIHKILTFAGASQELRLGGTIETKLRGILSSSRRLRELIGECVTSSDFHVLYPRYKENFDKILMDDAFARKDAKYDSVDSLANTVLLTTDLGLRRREKIKGAANTQDYLQQAIPLKAKVILRSAVSELVEGDVEMRNA